MTIIDREAPQTFGDTGDGGRTVVVAQTVAITARHCGPPGMANGGWVCGTAAESLGEGPVEATLLAPTPLDTPLDLRMSGHEVTVSHGDTTLVTAERSPGPVQAPAPVTWADAVAGEANFHGHHVHPFPGCFVCGTDRAVGDGLRIFTGPVPGDDARMAGTFTPGPDHAGPDGRLPVAAVWAALDCPTAWVNMGGDAVYLLGRIRSEILGRLWMGRSYVVVAESGGVDGRKAYGRAAVYDRDERLLAASEATWVRVRDRS